MSSIAPPIPRLKHSTSKQRLSPAARAKSLVRGREADPRWVRPALLLVLATAALLCFWSLTRNGYSNDYYAAAVKSASESWKALFFGSLDPGSFITVDKPPLSLWLMGMSARVFGFSSFSMLLPEALCTVAAVGLLYATVRRSFGATAGLIAAALLALTPITIAIGRVNNPDALLVLLLVGSAWFLMRAIESGRTKHLAWCGALVGLAFMTKMLQGWMVVPALAATYAIAGPPRFLTRVRQLAVAGGVMVAVSAAWPLAVTLWPGSTPYIGGSTNGSVWDLIFGYNGFGRITGSEGSGPGAGGGSFGGLPGLWRMFNTQVGGQIAWLIPLAAVSLVAGLWFTRRAPRADLRRAGIVLFGVWAVVHIAVFSSQKGIFHPYYVSALAPAIAALAGIGVVLMAKHAKPILALTIAGTAWLAVTLLERTPDFAPALRVVIPAAAAIAIVGLAIGKRARAAMAVAAVAGAIAIAAGPASYAVANLGHSLDGNNVLAGPSSVSQGSFGGMARQGGGPPSGAPTGSARPGGAPSGTPPSGGGAMGGGNATADSALIKYLTANQGSAKYLVAANGSHTTASIIIATGKPVVTIGGFSGQDPAPTVSQLAAMVKSGELKYVLVGSGGGTGGPGGGGSSSAITTWVKAHGKAVTSVTTSGGTLYKVSA